MAPHRARLKNRGAFPNQRLLSRGEKGVALHFVKCVLEIVTVPTFCFLAIFDQRGTSTKIYYPSKGIAWDIVLSSTFLDGKVTIGNEIYIHSFA